MTAMHLPNPKPLRDVLPFGAGAEIVKRTGKSHAHVHYVLHGWRRDAEIEALAEQLLADNWQRGPTTPTTRRPHGVKDTTE